jgi:thioredoxin 1
MRFIINFFLSLQEILNEYIMKKISLIVSLSTMLLFSACNTIGGNNNEGDPNENIEGTVIRINTEMFKKLVWDYKKSPAEFVFKGDQPCVIDFYADWCRPCKMVAPIMEELAKEYKGKVRIYKVNTDEEGELSRLFNIRSIPAILYVPKNGKPQMSVGLSGKDTYIKTIQDLLLPNDTVKK